jgi:TolA-binding protein
MLRLERAPFEPALDEQRALYAFYLRHPHAPEAARKRIDEARSSARTAKACAALDEAERLAAELWRVDKVKKIALADPDYPRDYALGILNYRRKTFEAAAESFRDWLDKHPDGPWTLRARNYLRASLFESGLQ